MLVHTLYRTNVPFRSADASNRLDIYLPKPGAGQLSISGTPLDGSSIPAHWAPSDVSKAPIIIFIPSPQYGMFRTKKWMMASLGRNLARMGYCVIIPDLIAFGDEPSWMRTNPRRRDATNRISKSRLRESIEDLRRVIQWTADRGG